MAKNAKLDNNKLATGDFFESAASGLVDTALDVVDNLANTFAPKRKGKYVTGARCKIKINEELVAFAFGISWRIDTVQDEIRTIDDYLAWEFAPSMIKVEGTITGLHMPGQGPTSKNIRPSIKEFLFHKYISIEVRDTTSDELLLWCPKAVLVSSSEDIKAEDLARQTLHWKAISFKDEVERDFPEGYDKKTGGKEGTKKYI